MAVWIENEECSGCESCVEACSFGSISMRDGNAVIDDTCTVCGACVHLGKIQRNFDTPKFANIF